MSSFEIVLFILILIIIPINIRTKVINIAVCKLNDNSYLRKLILLNFCDNFINIFVKNSVDADGYMDNWGYIWYVIIVINDDDNIINDNGTANIFAITEVIFNIEKWYMLRGITVIRANTFIDKNSSNFIVEFFIIVKIFVFVFIFLIFFIMYKLNIG